MLVTELGIVIDCNDMQPLYLQVALCQLLVR